MKEWIKVPIESYKINQINRRNVVTEEDFEVWGLGKITNGATWADITKRQDGYEIAIGRKFTKRGRWKQKYPNRKQALDSLYKEMNKLGTLKGGVLK